MKVELVDWTVNPQEKIELAASNCYDSIPNGKIMKSCYKSGHHSVLEFANFHFHIEGVSRACTHQLVRHRTGSYAQRSQRYCNEDGFGVVIPQSIKNDPQVLEQYRNTINRIHWFYDYAQAHGIPNEDARYILPNACTSIINISFDFRNLIHFMNERLCNKAQEEIRQVAQEMKRCVLEVFPEAKDMLVPKCERYEIPFCTEQKSCGRHKTLKEIVKEDFVKNGESENRQVTL